MSLPYRNNQCKLMKQARVAQLLACSGRRDPSSNPVCGKYVDENISLQLWIIRNYSQNKILFDNKEDYKLWSQIRIFPL